MSSKKSPNLKLHLWEPEDAFIRSEFNENSQKLDAAVAGKCSIATGTYIGKGNASGDKQLIFLGRRPRAVLIWDQGRATLQNHYGPYHTLVVDGCTENGAVITDQGFEVEMKTNLDLGFLYPALNGKNINYMYLAFF